MQAWFLLRVISSTGKSALLTLCLIKLVVGALCVGFSGGIAYNEWLYV